MPPRITRNSHRPRASDRTMVDTLNHHWLVALSTRWRRRQEAEKLMRTERQNSFPPSRCRVGWRSRIKSHLRSRQNFFLDIPFDRTSLLIELTDIGTNRLRLQC